MSAALALQTALRARLVATPAVVALVPAASILDRHQRPAPTPSIILGEAQVVEGDDFDRRQVRVFHTLHMWVREPSLEGATILCAAVRAAIHAGRLALGDGFHAADARVVSMRTMRDPDGETSHGVVAVDALVQEIGP